MIVRTRRWKCIAAVLLIAASCEAQSPSSQSPSSQPGNSGRAGDTAQAGESAPQEAQSVFAFSRSQFGKECGIRDTSYATAVGFSRTPNGEWSGVSASAGGGTVEMARIWHETNWMVDMHGALGTGMSSMHSGQMCFDAQGRITRMLDRYMDMLRCGCQRSTMLIFAEDGRITRRQEMFVNTRTGEELAPPPAAQDFPAVLDYRRLNQLPFFSLLDK